MIIVFKLITQFNRCFVNSTDSKQSDKCPCRLHMRTHCPPLPSGEVSERGRRKFKKQTSLPLVLLAILKMASAEANPDFDDQKTTTVSNKKTVLEE